MSGARLDPATRWRLAVDEQQRAAFRVQPTPADVVVHDGERRLRLRAGPMYRRDSAAPGGSGPTGSGADARPGGAGPGASRAMQWMPGQEVLVIEAMKMELAPEGAARRRDRRKCRAAAGDFVEADAVLVTLEP